MKSTEEKRASHDCLEALGECLTLIQESEDGIVFKFANETLEEMLERIKYDTSVLYSGPLEVQYHDLTGLIKRIRGLGKTNALYYAEISEATALLLFHALIYESYHIKAIRPREDGLCIELRENWI